MNRPEQALQISVVNWLRVVAPDLFFLHIPNGGRRSKAEAGIFKAMGLRPAFYFAFQVPGAVGRGKGRIYRIESSWNGSPQATR